MTAQEEDFSRPLDPRADAYLHWAEHTNFEYVPGQGTLAGMLVEFENELTQDNRAALAEAGVFVSRLYLGHRYCTVWITARKLRAQLEALHGQGLRRCELASPIAPAGAAGDTGETAAGAIAQPEGADVPPRAQDRRPASVGATSAPYRVLGIIDHGCAFAHPHYRGRIGLLWDQGGKVDESASSRAMGPVATPFGYGAAYEAQQLAARIADATPDARAQDQVDDDAAYARAGLPGLHGLVSHGSLVMSYAIGHLPTGQRISASRTEGGDATAAPPWREGAAGSSSADIAFVQLPEEATDDPSGRWLGQYVLDGIHAILNYRRNGVEPERVVINVSYGPQTGPHDGTALLEKAMDELSAPAPPQSQRIFMALPSGNAHLSRSHAEFDLARGGGTVEWHVSPDSQTPTFLEIWLPQGLGLSNVRVDVEDPADTVLTAEENRAVGSLKEGFTVLAVRGSATENRTMVLVAVAPTARPLWPTQTLLRLAVAGRWKVTVRPEGSSSTRGIAHAFLARNDHNMNAAIRGKPGYLMSRNYDANRFAKSAAYDAKPLPDSGAEVVALGSLSGIATGRQTRIAAGFVVASNQAASYSAGIWPDSDSFYPSFYPTDESGVFSGMPGSGNRGCVVARLVGTSTAAPQCARDLLDA